MSVTPGHRQISKNIAPNRGGHIPAYLTGCSGAMLLCAPLVSAVYVEGFPRIVTEATAPTIRIGELPDTIRIGELPDNAFRSQNIDRKKT